jgi:hypothetical protein
MPAAMRQLLIEHASSVSAGDGGVRRAAETLFLVATSPQFAVQK